jgi:hypothetical protein
MRIENLRSDRNGDRVRVTATVIWEDCDRPAYDLYFETTEDFADYLICNPDAFFIGCAIPAMHYGETRLFTDAEICPEVKNGMVTVMSWLRQWHRGGDGELVRIETKTRRAVRQPAAERAGFFFSGGVDSFATLRKNRLTVPPEHPRYFQDAVIAFGLELDDPQAFDNVLDHLSGVAKQAGIRLIPVYTNVYLPYRQEDAAKKFTFWRHEFMGAALAAIAHALAGRFTNFSIASTDAIPCLRFLNLQHFPPYGTHPLLDHHFSSTELLIHHDGVELSRFDKTRLIADWDLALSNLRVCNQYRKYRHDKLNCGRCEKCLRTKLALLALGALDRANSFADRDVSVDLVESAVRFSPYSPDEYIKTVYHWELLEPLAHAGKGDLAQVLRRKILSAQRQGHWPVWMRSSVRKLRAFSRVVRPWR